MLSDGKPFQPSSLLLARGWVPHPRFVPRSLEPKVAPDGTFNVTFDAESIALLFIDPEKRRSGFARVGWKDTALDLKMEPAATYGGTLLDENSQPMPGQSLSLFVKSGGIKPIATLLTDPGGASSSRPSPPAYRSGRVLETAGAGWILRPRRLRLHARRGP